MTDNINKISQAKSQQTSASIVNLNDEDVVKIWDAVSAYIESYMKQAKGVNIPGFGTFSFIQKRIDVGNNKYLLIQRPVFVLSEKIAQNHGLRYTRYPINGSIPLHSLNYFYLQTQTTYTRDQIDQCVKHVLQVLSRSIAAQRNVEFTFSHVGKLQIRNGKVKMRFFKDFVSSVDENAAKHIIENMCNRPQTCDSVMSEREANRPATSSNVVLPRLNSRIGNPSMQSIREDEEHEDENDAKLPTVNENLEESPANNAIKTIGSTTSQETIIPIASLFSSMDIIQPQPPPTATKRSPLLRRSKTSFSQNDQDTDRPNIAIRRSTNENPFRLSTCFHPETKQELCHQCHQRSKRNIPVYVHEEKRQRELDDTKLLEQYQHEKDLEEQKKRELAMKTAREERQRIAAFNLGIAEAARVKKLERPQTSDIPRSIIFRKRAKTPPSYLRQQEFARQLETQIKSKHDEQRSEKLDKDFVERLEQIQLAESLAHEREALMKNKRLRQEEFKSVLENQMQNKPVQLPTCETETPYFGLNDVSPEKLRERRLHAMDIVRQQKELIEQRQRQLLLKQIQDQERDMKAMESMRKDLIADYRERHRRNQKLRKDLENTWQQARIDKQQRDEQEKQHLKAPQGLLVHEQCDQYHRCAQCQRNLNNTGETNFWKDTRYIPGTHIMV